MNCPMSGCSLYISTIASHTNLSFGEDSTRSFSSGISMSSYLNLFRRAGETRATRILFMASRIAPEFSVTFIIRSSSASMIFFWSGERSSSFTWLNFFGLMIPASSPSTLSMNSVRRFCNAGSSFQSFITWR